jgi:hypothetical protein
MLTRVLITAVVSIAMIFATVVSAASMRRHAFRIRAARVETQAKVAWHQRQ